MKKNPISFLCGVLTTAVCISTALAGASYSGKISFNTNSLYMNGREILAAGESLTTEAGAEVPSSILYTDENGGGTYYVPVRPFAQVMDAEVKWDDDAIWWKVDGEQAIALLPETAATGTIYGDYIQNVDACVPEEGTELLNKNYSGTENFETILKPRANAGNTVTVIVTNEGRGNLDFKLGVRQGDSTVSGSIKVPAGETGVRTFRLLSEPDNDILPYIGIGSGDGVFTDKRFTVTAIQFEAEYPENAETGSLGKLEISGDGIDMTLDVQKER